MVIIITGKKNNSNFFALNCQQTKSAVLTKLSIYYAIFQVCSDNIWFLSLEGLS